MSGAPFTAEEIRVLKALASGILSSMSAGKGGSGGAQSAAPDSELDGRFSDPIVKRNPKRWAGESYEGVNFSRCSPEFLDCLAEALEYFADKASKSADPKKHRNGTPYYEYDRKDARLARGWARRIRAGWRPPADDSHDMGSSGDHGDAYEDPAPMGDEEFIP